MSGVDGGTGTEAAGSPRGNPLARGLVAFGRFWWDFLVGDTPEILLATLLVIALAEALHHHGAIGIVVVVGATVVCLVASVLRGRTRT